MIRPAGRVQQAIRSSTGENPRAVPDAVATPLHVEAEVDIATSDRAPVTRGLPPAIDAFKRRVHQVLAGPTFGANVYVRGVCAPAQWERIGLYLTGHRSNAV